jgi:hypothetical protein
MEWLCMVNTTATIKTTFGHTGQHCLRKGNKMTTETAFPAKALGGIGYTTGMTLRDYFAAKAMAVLMTSAWNIPHGELASKAYWFAEEMMKAREQA